MRGTGGVRVVRGGDGAAAARDDDVSDAALLCDASRSVRRALLLVDAALLRRVGDLSVALARVSTRTGLRPVAVGTREAL